MTPPSGNTTACGEYQQKAHQAGPGNCPGKFVAGHNGNEQDRITQEKPVTSLPKPVNLAAAIELVIGKDQPKCAAQPG